MNGWTLGKILRRGLLYLGIALASLGAVGAVAALSVYTHVEISFRWVGFALFTSILLWTLIRSYKAYWRNPVWWLTLVSMVGIHLLAFVPLLRTYTKWSVLWFWPLTIVEFQIFATILDTLFTWRKRKHG